MAEYLEFLAKLGGPLYSAFQYVERTTDSGPDPVIEQQLAMAIVRRISDERARREIERTKEEGSP